MPNPKDWFRRRRPTLPSGPAPENADPFIGDAILDLGRGATMLQQTPAISEARASHSMERRGSVPPPRAQAPRREGAVLDRSAFAVRPEIVRNGGSAPRRLEETRPSLHGLTSAHAASSAPSPFVLRRGSAAPLGAASPAEPAPRPPRLEPKPAATRGTESGGNEMSETAAFTLAAPGTAWMRTRPSTPESGKLSALLRDAFTPTRPKQAAGLFSGRFKQMQRIIAAIEEERAHVMLYGERGSGKTSLANILAGKADEAGYLVLRFACSSGLRFEDIFRAFLRRMPATLLADGIGATSRAGIDNFEQLLSGPCSVAELVSVFERIDDKHLILIIDEYDRVSNDETKALLAELIKNMSDAAVPVTLLIIGVAENVSELLGKHPSLQRTVVTVPMPLMTRREIDGIIAAGEEKSGLQFDPGVRQTIADLAQGLPYHAQLLCLFAARSAVRRHSPRIEREDLRYAVQCAAEEAETRVKESYNLAIGPHESTSFRDVLFYAARCRSDEFGTFSATDVAAAAAGPGSEGLSLLALQYPLKKLTEPERGAVLRRLVGPGGLRYQFRSQMIRHHVLVRQAEQRGLV